RDRGPAGIGERHPFVLVVDGPGDGDRLRSWCGAVRDDQQRAIGLLVLTALPCVEVGDVHGVRAGCGLDRAPQVRGGRGGQLTQDRKSTRLNSSHVSSSYAVFCLKKKTI